MRFSDLHEEGYAMGLDVGDVQTHAQRCFPDLVREHGLSLVDLSRPLPPVSGTYVLIGVAAGYSGLDLQALDDVCGALRGRADERIELLDISGPDYPRDVIDLIRPGVPQGSVVAVWESGRLVRTEYGARARSFLRARYLGQA